MKSMVMMPPAMRGMLIASIREHSKEHSKDFADPACLQAKYLLCNSGARKPSSINHLGFL